MNDLKPSQIAKIAGGAVTLLFSFFDFVSYKGFGSNVSASAWSTDANLFPLATWPAIFGAIVAGTTAAVAFGNVKLPDPILTLNWKQINFMLSFASLAIMVGFLLANENKGYGFWLMFLGVLAYAAGSVMDLLGIEPGASAAGPTGPPTSF